MYLRVATVGLSLLLCWGCASTERVDVHNDTETTVSFDIHDIEAAAAMLSQSLLQARRIGATSEKPVLVAFGHVTNDTCQLFDTDVLLRRLEEALVTSDRFEVSAVFAGRASGRDDQISAARSVRGNAAFDAASIQQQGQLRVPDISISGKLTQRNVRRDNGGTRIEYFVTLKATRLADGVVVWQRSFQTVKAVAAGMPVW